MKCNGMDSPEVESVGKGTASAVPLRKGAVMILLWLWCVVLDPTAATTLWYTPVTNAGQPCF